MTHEPSSPDTLNFSHIDITLPWVERGDRQRSSVSDTSDLQQSIAQLGLLQPPVVRRGDYKLMAGERRWEACKALGWSRLPVRWLESLAPLDAQLVELAENIKRQALPWQDEAKASARIFGLLPPATTQEELARLLGVSPGHVAKQLKVAKGLEEAKIAAAGGLNEAYNILTRREQRQRGEALEELLGLAESQAPQVSAEAPEVAPTQPASASQPSLAPPGQSLAVPLLPVAHIPPTAASLPSSPIRHANFLEWLRSGGPSQQPKFTLAHCDFPYGLELFAGQQGRGAEPTAGYEDSAATFFELLQAFCDSLDSFLAMSAHVVFWFSAKHRQPMMECLRERAPSLAAYPYDLIWHKSDNAGIAGDYRRHPRHTYEQALLLTRGGRHILGVAADSYAAPTDKRLHPSCKPEPMLRHFLGMLVDGQSRVFDPTCGSGSALRAAASLGATQLLGLEADAAMAEAAGREFRLRSKAPASPAAPAT